MPKIRALIVDDYKIGIMVLSEMLQMIGEDFGVDFEISIADSGPEAIKEYELHQFELIFLDIRMPDGMDGLQVAREIRRREAIEDKPITKMIAYSAEIFVDTNGDIASSDLLKYKKNGFDYCLPKPVRKADLEKFFEKYKTHQI